MISRRRLFSVLTYYTQWKNVWKWFSGNLSGWNHSLNDKAWPAVLCQEVDQVSQFLKGISLGVLASQIFHSLTQQQTNWSFNQLKTRVEFQIPHWTRENFFVKGRCQHQARRKSRARTLIIFSLLDSKLPHFWRHLKFDWWCISSCCCYFSLNYGV